MMHYTYTPKGVCSKKMEIILEGDIIADVAIERGCPGNLLGLKNLVIGQPVSEVIRRLEGIPCGNKATSCPDQLAQALKEAVRQ